jgi:alpha-tubulin suppressor-like RCC1 family protein
VLATGLTLALSGCRLYGWGTNGFGQIGIGTTSLRVLAPTQVGTATDWRTVAAGMEYSCGVRDDGSLWCWGRNQRGQLGDGTITDRHQPVQIGTATDWRSVSTTNIHTCGIRSDGSLWCWGLNDVAQASGDGTPTNGVLTPVRVGTDSWKTVRAGRFHTCAIRIDDTLWCWGGNVNGQLGDGTITERHAPVQVGSAAWTRLSAGKEHTCGIQADRSLWCWGNNERGQVGIGTISAGVLEPTRVGTATDWIRISAGGFLGASDSHTCGIRDGGSLWCWGANGAGQLGDGTDTERPLPVPIGLDTWRTVSAGGGHTCAIRSDSTLWCWGANGNGTVGDGTTMSRNAPVQIGTLARWFIVDASTSHTHALLMPE